MNKMLAIPERKAFTAPQFEEFIDLLREMDQHTVRMTISDVADIELDEGGHLKNGGFTLAPLAFQQVCRQVSKGLWSLASDIAGFNSGVRSFDDAISVPLAARIVNDCIKLRFRAHDGLTGRDMIQDHAARVVDGIVGPRYQLLPNHQLLEAVDDMLKDHEVPMYFYAGTLVGRRMSVVYLTRDPLRIADDGPIYGGAYFANSEAGECAVRGATILQIGSTMRCMNKLRHLNHSGKDFIKRLSHMLSVTMLTWEKTVEVAQRAPEVMAQELPLLTPEQKVSKAARQKLQTALAEYVDKSVASDVVRKVIYMGADGTHVPRNVSASEIATRCVRDAVHVIMRAADGQYPEVQESLERAAFDILSGKAKIRSQHGDYASRKD